MITNKLYLVSIQIPTFNQKEYLKQALDSALAQSFDNLQIIVADDCSLYDVYSCLFDYINQPKLEILVNKTNKGRVKNYHDTLYDKVKGDFFVNLDGDDFFLDNNFIEYGALLLSENEKLNPLFFQGNHNIEKIKSIVSYKVLDDFTIAVNSREYLKSYTLINEFCHAATLFNTAKAKMIGFYNFDCIFSDFNSAARLMLLNGTLFLSSKKFAHWRQHEANETWSLDTSNYKNEILGIKNIFVDESSFEFKKVEKELKNKIFNSVMIKQDKSKFNFNQLYFLLFTFQFNKNYIYMILRYLLIKIRVKNALN